MKATRRFKRYPKCKDSGVEWLGEIPGHWEVKRLKFGVALNPSPLAARRLPANAEVSFVPMEAVGEYGGLDLSRTKLLGDVGLGYTYFADGDVVVAKITPCFENGKGALAADLANGVAFGTTELHVLRAIDTVERKYLFYATLTDAFRRLGEAEMYGAGGQKRVPESFVHNLKHPLPPDAEQRAIAAFLDRETARVDALVAKKELLIELLQEKRTALITHAVTKGLDPAVPMKDTGVEWLGDIPSHWTLISLKRLADVRYGLGEPPQMLADGLPFIRATNVCRGRIVETDMLFVDPRDVPWNRDPVLRTGDIIVVRSGAYTGDSAIITQDYDGAIAGYDMVVRLRRGHAPFIAWALLSEYVLEAQTKLKSMRAAQPHLNAEELGTTVLILPPEAEQRSLAGFLNRETAKLDTLIAEVNVAIDRLKELRTALISAAVTGKIDVREEAA